MDQDKFRELCKALKNYLPTYVSEVTQKSKGKNMYNCPLCGSGTHSNGTGAFSLLLGEEGSPIFHCFACGRKGDVVDLHAELTGQGKSAAAEDLANRYGLNTATPIAPVVCDIEPNSAERSGVARMRYEYETTAKPVKDVPKAVEYLKGRGISIETASRLGLKANYRNLYYPSDSGQYVHCRGMDSGFKGHIGTPEPFNWAALSSLNCPVFVVEGQADALSLEEVGCKAVALCSTVNAESFAKRVIKDALGVSLVLMLDNDNAGKEKEPFLFSWLKAGGVRVVCLDREEWGYNAADPNDWLKQDRSAFEKLGGFSIERFDDQLQREAMAEETAPPDYPEESYQGKKDEGKKYETLKARITYRDWQPKSFGDIESQVDDQIADTTETISTGLDTLDKVLKGGGLSNGLYLFGAPPATGKSAFCMQLADHIAEMGHKVLYYSLEMTAAEIKTRTFARLSKQLSIARDGDPDKNIVPLGLYEVERIFKEGRKSEHPAIFKQYDRIKTNLFGEFFEESRPTVEVIEAQIDRFIELFGDTRPVVFVDYLQLIRLENAKTDGDTVSRLGEVAALLKRLSNKCPIIAISSINRVSYKDVNLGAFRGSGELEYSANFAGILVAEDATDDKTKDISLCVVKNRSGVSGVDVLLKFYGENLWFKDKGQYVPRGTVGGDKEYIAEESKPRTRKSIKPVFS